MTAATFFAGAADFRAWLDVHAATTPELLVGYHKVASGTPSMTWPQSVDEALCVGWIDGVRRRINDTRYCIRFTPRRPGSIWSAVNIAKVAALRSAGRMTPAGEAAFAARREDRSGVYAFERELPAELDAAETAAFRAQAAAWRFFEAQPPGYRRVVLHWVVSAKRADTRARRLLALVEACGRGERLR